MIFDTETSGLDFDKDQIIELAALRVERTASGGLRIAGKMDTFIKLPEGETLPENIVSLTGITDALLQTEGVQPAKAASQIAKLMQPGPVLMIAHNAQFDACFLRGLLRGAKVGRIDWLDSLTVYKDRRPYPHKLANAILAYELEDKVQNSHRAIDDVLALFEVLKAMDDERDDLAAYHITAPDPKGTWSAACIQQALADADMTPEQVDYVNAHGTSTPLNDSGETAAIHQVFGDHAKNLMVSSTKSMTGHLLGASGAVEAMFSVLALKDGYVPATINYQVPDPACDLDIVPNEGRQADIKVAISDSLGFGGHNTCLVFQKWEG